MAHGAFTRGLFCAAASAVVIILGAVVVQADHSSLDILNTFAFSKSTKPLTSYGDGYYNEQHVACFKETQLSRCGLLDPYIPDTYPYHLNCHVSVQSDFACCRGSEDTTFNFVGLDMSVGQCVWDLNILIDCPIHITDTVARIGTATATCQLTSDVGKCGGPECEKMLISLQGNIYAADAYSHEPTFTHQLGADNDQCNDCCLLADLVSGSPQLPDQCLDCNGCLDNCDECWLNEATKPGQPAGKSNEGREVKVNCGECCWACFNDRKAAVNNTAPGRQADGWKRWRDARKQKLQSKKGSVTTGKRKRNGGVASQDPPVYKGLGTLAVGTAYLVTLKDKGHEKVEEVGLFSSVLDWVVTEELDGPPTQDLHWIEPATMHLMWKKEEPQYNRV